MKTSVFLILVLSFLSCKWDAKSSALGGRTKEKIADPAVNDSLELFFKSKGVILYNNTEANEMKGFSIYNQDNSVFAKVLLKSDEFIIKGKKYKLSNYEQAVNDFFKLYNFSPKAFFPQSGFIFQFEYKSIKNNKIEIYISKDKSETKYLNFDTKLFTIETWRQHMIGRIIDFNLRNNPLKTQPLNSSESINLKGYNDIAFSIKKIEGEWVEIECTSFCDIRCPDKKITGWIKWRNKNGILIRFAYAC